MEFARGRGGDRLDMADVVVHSAGDFGNELIEYLILPFQHHLDSPVRQIADVSADIILQGEVLGGVAETDPLNPAVEVVGLSMCHGASSRVLRVDAVYRFGPVNATC